MRGDDVAAPVRDALDCRLERRVLERLDLAAVVTHEVVMMIAADVSGLEPRDAVAEIDPLDEPELVQAVERPVDARDPDPPAACPHAVVDLLGGEAAVLLAEKLDDEPPRTAAAPARGSEAGSRPCSVQVWHSDNDTRSQRRATVSCVPALLATLVLVLVLGTGCAGDEPDQRPTVVAAFYPLAWAAEQIGGDSIDVVNLTPPGAEPHDVELTPRDVEKIQNADLVLYLGSGFQPALEHAVEGRSGPSLDLLDGQKLMTGADAEQGAYDPHVWLDPSRLAAMVTLIGAQLHREPAAARLVAKLEALDSELADGLAHCSRHEIVTSHAAFGYLAKRYGLKQLALTGLSPEAEPSPRDLEALVDEVKRTDATTVFFETLVSSEARGHRRPRGGSRRPRFSTRSRGSRTTRSLQARTTSP